MRSVPGLTSPPEALDDFVLSMLAKEPSARPASMDEVVQALRDFSYQLEDAGLLDTTPAQEVDPVALKGWFAEGDDFPGASSEMPAVGPPTPTAHLATPSAAPTLESSRDDLVPTREVAAGGLELPALEPTTHQNTTTRNALVAVGAGVAICLVAVIYLVLVRAPEEPIVLEDTTAAAPSVAPAEPTPAAQDEPAAPDTVPAADVAVDTPDASSELELLREREVAAVGAAAIQAAGVIMLAQELCEPDDAPSKTSPPRRKKPGRRRPGRSSKDDTKKSALTDAVKGTF
jgi:serine/threonine-protein kinase